MFLDGDKYFIFIPFNFIIHSLGPASVANLYGNLNPRSMYGNELYLYDCGKIHENGSN